jgi:hypothetical protein
MLMKSSKVKWKHNEDVILHSLEDLEKSVCLVCPYLGYL